MMKPERMIEILGKVLKIPSKTMESYIENDSHDLTITLHEALTAMQRAVEEETATLRAEVERLKEYTKHDEGCHYDWNLIEPKNTCTCGLDTPANG